MNIIERYPNADILNIDSKNFYKNAPFLNDTLMYYDEHHLNRYAAENLAKISGDSTMVFLNKYIK